MHTKSRLVLSEVLIIIKINDSMKAALNAIHFSWMIAKLSGWRMGLSSSRFLNMLSFTCDKKLVFHSTDSGLHPPWKNVI